MSLHKLSTHYSDEFNIVFLMILIYDLGFIISSRGFLRSLFYKNMAMVNLFPLEYNSYVRFDLFKIVVKPPIKSSFSSKDV